MMFAVLHGLYRTMLRSLIYLAVIFPLLVAAQWAWHHHLTADSLGAQWMRTIYTHKEGASGKGSWPWFDTIIPSIIIGIGWGIASRKLSLRYFIIGVLILAGTTVGTTFICMYVTPSEIVWWMPTDTNGKRGFYAEQFIFSGVFVAFSAYGSRSEMNRRRGS